MIVKLVRIVRPSTTHHCLDCPEFGLAVRNDLLGDEIEVLKVAEVQHLEIHALYPGISKTTDGGGGFGHRPGGTICPQFVGFPTDCGRTADELGFVAARSHHQCRRVAQGSRVPADQLARLADPGAGLSPLTPIVGDVNLIGTGYTSNPLVAFESEPLP